MRPARRTDQLPVLWEPLLDDFARYELGVLGLAPSTVGNHGSYLRAFAAWWDRERGPREPQEATRADLSDFLVHEAVRGLAAATRRSQVAALRGFFDWLEVTGCLSASPAASLPTPRVAPPNVEIYSPDDVATILEHTAGLTDLRGRQRHAIVALLRYTGMRSVEARTLRTDDLELRSGRARVLGKAARPRVVLIPGVLQTLLQRFLTQDRVRLPTSPLLFVNPHPFVTTPQRGFGQEALAREVELAGLGAGVAGRHFPHKWRHTFATELVRDGVDIHVVQRLLGHTSIASTVGYSHLAVDDLQARMAVVWPDS